MKNCGIYIHMFDMSRYRLALDQSAWRRNGNNPAFVTGPPALLYL